MTNDSEAGDTKQHGRGVFDCPLKSCDDVIVGTYTDLLTHVRGHPLARLLVNENGTELLTEIEEARSDALTKDIRATFCVDAGDEPNDTASTDTNRGGE